MPGRAKREERRERFCATWSSACSLRELAVAILIPLLVNLLGLSGAGVAQLVEHLICNQRVGGSIPSASSTGVFLGSEAERNLAAKARGLVSLDTSPICVFASNVWNSLRKKFGTRGSRPKSLAGRVGEWLKPADCKSAAPCGLRRFESFPVHQALVGPAGTAGQSQASDVHWRLMRVAREACAAENALDGSRTKRPKPAGEGSAWVAQLVERVLGKDEVTGSIPVPGSRTWQWLTADGRGLSGGNSTVESHSSKVMVAGSNPVPRSKSLQSSAALV